MEIEIGKQYYYVCKQSAQIRECIVLEKINDNYYQCMDTLMDIDIYEYLPAERLFTAPYKAIAAMQDHIDLCTQFLKSFEYNLEKQNGN